MPLCLRGLCTDGMLACSYKQHFPLFCYTPKGETICIRQKPCTRGAHARQRTDSLMNDHSLAHERSCCIYKRGHPLFPYQQHTSSCIIQDQTDGSPHTFNRSLDSLMNDHSVRPKSTSAREARTNRPSSKSKGCQACNTSSTPMQERGR